MTESRRSSDTLDESDKTLANASASTKARPVASETSSVLEGALVSRPELRLD